MQAAIRKLFLLLCLGSLLAFVGCSLDDFAPNSDQPSFEAPMDPADREALLEHFPLLDQAQNPAPAYEPTTHTAPFGVLVLMMKTDGYYCSASHIVPGRVVTNAHCVNHPGAAPSDYSVVFYNHQGTEVHYQVQDFRYVGDTNADDIAVLDIADEAANEWDSAGDAQLPTDKLIPDPPMSTPADHQEFAVRLWSFDPFVDRQDVEYDNGKFGIEDEVGMIFSPRKCQGSRTLPTVQGVVLNGDGSINHVQTFPANQLNPRIHVFLDQCDRAPIRGNSGSLITDRDNFTAKVGVYHWAYSPTDTTKVNFNYYNYTGNDGTTHQLTLQQLKGGLFFGVGTVFESELLAHPALF